MRSIRIDFGERGPRFNFASPVQDFDATVQAALVNIGTDRGSDPVFADRGTDLKVDGTNGRMSTTVWANHSANYAALRTLSFVQQNDVESNAWKLQSLALRCVSMNLTTAILEVRAVSEGGTVVGGFANI